MKNNPPSVSKAQEQRALKGHKAKLWLFYQHLSTNETLKQFLKKTVLTTHTHTVAVQEIMYLSPSLTILGFSVLLLYSITDTRVVSVSSSKKEKQLKGTEKSMYSYK